MASYRPEKQPNGFRPIEEAPIRDGEPWGPAVIFPSETGWFAFAEWDGQTFFNKVSGELVQPEGYLELPASPSSISFKI